MKSKSLIFRTLAYLVYPGKLASEVVIKEESSILIKTGPMSKKMRISVSRLKDHLTALEQLGFVKDLSIERYWARCKVVDPTEVK